MVYAVYTPYVIFWLKLDPSQYWHWLIGGVPMALAFNLCFTPIYAKMIKRWPISG